MTDSPTTQSVLIDDIGYEGLYIGATGGTVPTKLVYTSNLTTAETFFTASTDTSGQITSYPIGPAQSGFPLSAAGLDFYTIQPFNGTTPLGSKIRYEIVCDQKYPNVRIKWKNRFGQFDWFNFNMVNRQSLSTTKRTYQPTLGSWEGSTFSYQSYNSSMLDYIVDTKQSLQVNTNWVNENYNDIFKQLLVSDEIYWCYDESDYTKLRPLSIATSNIQFKTGVVDKLIQYAFDFNLGQSYKLIM